MRGLAPSLASRTVLPSPVLGDAGWLRVEVNADPQEGCEVIPEVMGNPGQPERDCL